MKKILTTTLLAISANFSLPAISADIFGYVFDEDTHLPIDTNINNISIDIYEIDDGSGTSTWIEPSQPDSSGYFSFSDLPAGNYNILISTWNNTGGNRYKTEYYDNSYTWDNQTTITLSSFEDSFQTSDILLAKFDVIVGEHLYNSPVLPSTGGTVMVSAFIENNTGAPLPIYLDIAYWAPNTYNINYVGQPSVSLTSGNVTLPAGRIEFSFPVGIPAEASDSQNPDWPDQSIVLSIYSSFWSPLINQHSYYFSKGPSAAALNSTTDKATNNTRKIPLKIAKGGTVLEWKTVTD